MVVWDLREEMVDDMSPNVMVDVVDPPVVPVERCQATPKIGPFLSSVPWKLVIVSVMMQVGDEVEPHDKNPVGDQVELEHLQRAHEEGEAS